MRLCVSRALAREIRDRGLTAKDLIRLLCEEEESSVRREMAHFRANRTVVGMERMQVYCEVLRLDVFAIIAEAASSRRLAS